MNHHGTLGNLDEDNSVVSLIGGLKEYFDVSVGIDGGTHQGACQVSFWRGRLQLISVLFSE